MLRQDVSYALRAMRRRPGIAAVMVLTLALGIGASVSVFSVISAVLLKPLPYPDPERLVLLVNTYSGTNIVGVSVPRFVAWRDHTDAVQDAAAYNPAGSMNLSIGPSANADAGGTQVVAGRVTASFFRLFGVPIAKGRAFTDAEDRPNGPRVVLISDGLWQRQFGRAADIIGRDVQLKGESYVVIGVVAAAFDPRSAIPVILPPPDIWVPLQLDAADPNDANNLLIASRLKPGVSLATAQAQAQAGAAAFRQRIPQNMPAGASFNILPLKQAVVEDVQPSLLLLAASVALVLLIVIVNTACLLLMRASDRQREMAIRIATGASRGRLVRQLLTESLVIASIGGALGLLAGFIGIRVLLALQPGDLPRIAADGSDLSITADWRVPLFALIASIAVGAAIGVLPALRASRAEVDDALRFSGGGDRTGGSLRHERTRALLVVSEVALASMLLVSTGLVMRSFMELRRVHPGFDVDGVLAMNTLVTESRYSTTMRTTQVMNEAIDAVRGVPGVESAGATLTGIPLEGQRSTLRIGIAGQTHRNVMGDWHVVSPEYVTTLKTPLIRGRQFTNGDRAHSLPVAIINQAMARQLWPNGDPFGDRLIAGLDGGPDFVDVPRQIVGIVGDVHQGTLARAPRAAIYVPLAQLPDREMALFNRHGGTLTWVVRTTPRAGLDSRPDPYRVSGAVQDALRSVTHTPVARVRSMRDVASASTNDTQFEMYLMTLFGIAALLLAGLGVYGVTAYSVQQRTREIGIRVALGATPRAIRGLVVMRGVGMTLLGIIAGLATAAALARVLARFLFGIGPHDAVVFAIVPCVLAFIAFAAVWLPARRATRVDPAIALRAN